MTKQPVFVVSCWLVITVTAFVDPFRLVSAWPVTVFAFLVIVRKCVAELGAAFACKEQGLRTGLHILGWRAVLVLLAGCAIAGAIASVVPSMAYLEMETDLYYMDCVSDRVAPLLWGAIFCTSAGAFMVPSPRRLALAAGAGLAGWPLLLCIRVLREPGLSYEFVYLELAPGLLKLYVAAAFVASGLAVALALGAARLAAEPVRPRPPSATVASRAGRRRASRG